MSKRKLFFDVQIVAVALAVWSALCMLLIWSLANLGLYVNVARMMSQWHMFFNLTFVGLVGGMIEAAAISFIGYILLYGFIN